MSKNRIDEQKTAKISNEMMEKLHKCTQEILDAFVTICEEYHLKYYFLYGTLLGAIRHEGPIPWDDDVDVCMPREDYEKFKQIMLARNEEETFHIHCFENDSSQVLDIVKVEKKGTLYKTYVNIDSRFQEVWIDVFPLDESPGSMFWRIRLLCWTIEKLKMLLTTKAIKTIKHLKLKRKFAHMLLTPVPVKAMYTLTERLMKLENNKGYQYYISWAGKYSSKKQMMPKEWFGEPVEVLYDGKYYNAPCKWDKVLTQLYGNYMELPPEEKREQHAPIEIDI